MESFLAVTYEDIDNAAKKMKSGKAVGVDSLRDVTLLEALKKPSIKEKIRSKFESWLNQEIDLPQYMKTAKTIFLSKDEHGSQFPKEGEVRIIAVLPAITKLYELVLHDKLLKDLS